MSAPGPIRRQVLVDAAPEVAFEVFTTEIGRWWPLADLSVHGAGSSVSFEGDAIVERSAAGDLVTWGTVTRWDPPAGLNFSWHPGRTANLASAVALTFAAAGTQTLVTLEHSGWEQYDDPAKARAEYDEGWPVVLDLFLAQVASRPPAGETWVALLHSPGPVALAAGGNLFAQPGFQAHVAFLERMHGRGFLLAAGPLADQAGDGMTILRLPGEDRLEEATRLATEDDLSVASGFFAVTVRPWQVVMKS